MIQISRIHFFVLIYSTVYCRLSPTHTSAIPTDVRCPNPRNTAHPVLLFVVRATSIWTTISEVFFQDHLSTMLIIR